jgi:hypothetical protein
MNRNTSGKNITLSNIGPGTSTPQREIVDNDDLLSMGKRKIGDQNNFADTEFVELESIGDEELFIVNETYNGNNAHNEDEPKNLISFVNVIESKESCV